MKLSTILWVAGVLVAGMGIPHARIVAVYDPSGDMASVGALKDQAESVVKGEAPPADKFTTIVTEGNILTPALSVKPGVVAYFWTDSTFETMPGFELLGESMLLESGLAIFDEGLAKQGLKEAAPAKVWVTGLQRASLSRGTLRLNYSVSRPGRVSVDVYGITGQRVGSWAWQESASGAFEKSFDLDKKVQGTLFLHWKNGDTRIIRKLHTIGAGG